MIPGALPPPAPAASGGPAPPSPAEAAQTIGAGAAPPPAWLQPGTAPAPAAAGQPGDAFFRLLDASPPSLFPGSAPAGVARSEPTLEPAPAKPEDPASVVVPLADELLRLMTLLPVAAVPAAPAPVPQSDPASAAAAAGPMVGAGLAAPVGTPPLPVTAGKAILPMVEQSSSAPAAFALSGGSSGTGANAEPSAGIPAAAAGAELAIEVPGAAADSAAPLHPLGLPSATGISTPSMAPTSVRLVAAPPLAQPADPQDGYGDALGTHLTWLVERGIGQAQIRIAPEHLGTIDVQLHLDGSRVHAEFFSAQAEVRQALETSLPRLRDLLGQHGLQLAHAGVGQERGSGAPYAAPPARTSPPESEPPPQTAVFHRRRGLLDVYA